MSNTELHCWKFILLGVLFISSKVRTVTVPLGTKMTGQFRSERRAYAAYCVRQLANDVAIILGIMYLSFSLSLQSIFFLSKNGFLWSSDILFGVLNKLGF